MYVCVSCVFIATPPCELIDKDHIASQIRSRMGCIIESADHVVSPDTIPLSSVHHWSLPPSLTHSLPLSLPPSLTHSLSPSFPPSLTPSLPPPFLPLFPLSSLSLSMVQVLCEQCYVLSDGYCRTKKYMMGLALGLPCVSYGWIRECIDKVYIH